MVQVGLEPLNVASTIEAKTTEQIENFRYAAIIVH